MSTSRNRKQPKQPNEKSVKSAPSISRTLTGWRAALTGLLLICVAVTSGCSLRSKPSVEPKAVTVDASLMVKPNLTKQLLSVLSE